MLLVEAVFLCWLPDLSGSAFHMAVQLRQPINKCSGYRNLVKVAHQIHGHSHHDHCVCYLRQEDYVFSSICLFVSLLGTLLEKL